MPQMGWLARQDGYDPDAFDVPSEQSTNVGWANRMGEILTTRPTYDEQTVLHSTASPLVNITEGDIGRATEAAMGVSGGGMSVRDPLRMYHATMGDLAKFGLAPEYRGATYLAQTPEGAMKGAIGGRQDFYATPDAPPPTWRTHKVDVPNEGISGLHWTPAEQQWHGSLPAKLVGDEALEAALKNQPNYGQIPWDDLYEHRKVGDRLYEYLKKPPKEYTLEEAAKTNRDIYGSQIPGYNSGNDRDTAKRLRELGMKGFIISDEGGVSLAHIDPELLKIAPPGIRAYHSSPHDFDKFDLAKIGSGEGAQVYGHGLYFAESPAVSGQGGQYWQQFANRFSGGGPEYKAMTYLNEAGFDRGKAIKRIEEQIAAGEEYYNSKGIKSKVLENYKQARDLLASDKPVGPRTYEVNINADPAHMLDWDKALREQSELRSKIEPLVLPHLKDTFNKNVDAGIAGANVYRNYIGGSDVGASQIMRDYAGIPGIKYLDQGSRPAFAPSIVIDDGKYLVYAGQKSGVKPSEYSTLEAALAAKAEAEAAQKAAQTSNYVVFDPSIIDIMKKYVVPGAIGAGGMGALARQDEYQ